MIGRARSGNSIAPGAQPGVSDGPLQLWILVLRTVGRLDEAILQIGKAVELDPLSANCFTWLGQVYRAKGQYDLAIAQLRHAIELDPSLWRPHWHLAFTYGQMKKFEDAIAEAQKACELSGPIAPTLGALGWAYALAGRHSEAEETMEMLESRDRERYLPPFSMSLVCVALGREDQALEWLEKGVEERDVIVVSTLRPEILHFYPMRGHPRFQALLQKINLA